LVEEFNPNIADFLTKRTTVRVKRQKGPPAKKFIKKDHISVAACLARRHMSRAAWAKSGKPLPPPPAPAGLLTNDAVDSRYPDGACRLGQRRHAGVARQGAGYAGYGYGGRAHHWKQRSTATAVSQHAGAWGGGKGLPNLAQAARDTCRLARRAATETWSFLIKKFVGGLF
jgi:hypothetical protein